MSPNETQADAEAAYAIEHAQNDGLRAMCTVAPPEIVRMAWVMAYMQGRVAGLRAAEEIWNRHVDVKRDVECDPRNDWSTRGEPLKPGT